MLKEVAFSESRVTCPRICILCIISEKFSASLANMVSRFSGVYPFFTAFDTLELISCSCFFSVVNADAVEKGNSTNRTN